ncbi:MAG: oxygen-independent coproporphyrinogen III oxidase [Deltaproteobacteria bacterium]|nr:MAG: oxygen-independent coproporphyrinogen III oxidase [Deltaproteobacteria bacterium]
MTREGQNEGVRETFAWRAKRFRHRGVTWGTVVCAEWNGVPGAGTGVLGCGGPLGSLRVVPVVADSSVRARSGGHAPKRCGACAKWRTMRVSGGLPCSPVHGAAVRWEAGIVLALSMGSERSRHGAARTGCGGAAREDGTMTTTPDFSPELIRRYDRRLPRYTSYPTAPHFSMDVDEERLAALVGDRGAADRPLSLYVHVPFCRSLCWYCGCATVISKSEEQRRSYMRLLRREIEHKAGLVDTEREVIQVHFGGGTPSDLPPDVLREIGEVLHSTFRVAPHAEEAIEIDPRDLTREHVRAMREAGFRRASIGVQDTQPRVQAAINRVQPFALVEQAFRWLREEGFESVNVDLIYGLPAQTEASIRETIQEVLTLSPSRLAVYGYAHVPGMRPAQRLLERYGIPGSEERLAMLGVIVGTLTDAGYEHIGMDHYARPDDELSVALREGTLQRNFQGYSTRGGADILGFGMSAISSIGRAYVAAPRTLDDWAQAVERDAFPAERWMVLSEDDLMRRRIIESIMCVGRPALDEVSEEFGVDPFETFARELEGLGDLEEDGLIERTPGGFRVTPRGRFLVRHVAARFDAWLEDDGRRYSAAI